MANYAVINNPTRYQNINCISSYNKNMRNIDYESSIIKGILIYYCILLG